MSIKIDEETVDDITYFIGRNARSNWKLLDTADPNDIWVHLHNMSSPYVIIQNEGELNDDDIRNAAEICNRYSNNLSRKATICYLPVKYVKKGKTMGEAIMKKPATIKSFHFK